MLILKRKSLLVLLCLVSSLSMASFQQLQLLKGHGAYVNDTTYSGGPTSSTTNTPGRWLPNIINFNSGAHLGSHITRLYVYSGAIDFNCDGSTSAQGTACVYSGSDQNVFVNYLTPAYGEASVAAYRALGNMAIYARFTGPANTALRYSNVGQNTAAFLARAICGDPNVDGVVLDMDTSGSPAPSPGLLTFYHDLGYHFSSSLCRDSNHPYGRTFGVVVKSPDAMQWGDLRAVLGSQGYVILSGYDLYPGPLATNFIPFQGLGIVIYAWFLEHQLVTMNWFSSYFHIRYTVAIPAAASSSEFESGGNYRAASPPCDVDPTRGGSQQIDYVRSARTLILARARRNRFFYGTDYKEWSQYTRTSEPLTSPCNPDVASGVVPYLQRYGYA